MSRGQGSGGARKMGGWRASGAKPKVHETLDVICVGLVQTSWYEEMEEEGSIRVNEGCSAAETRIEYYATVPERRDPKELKDRSSCMSYRGVSGVSLPKRKRQRSTRGAGEAKSSPREKCIFQPTEYQEEGGQAGSNTYHIWQAYQRTERGGSGASISVFAGGNNILEGSRGSQADIRGSSQISGSSEVQGLKGSRNGGREKKKM
ncbi:hypothetical protein C8R43DRAFT_1114322 [Mycena crocata]|nr:hypothetical protein C8R43DRAFT_1114322 [Mycena crocata]